MNFTDLSYTTEGKKRNGDKKQNYRRKNNHCWLYWLWKSNVSSLASISVYWPLRLKKPLKNQEHSQQHYRTDVNARALYHQRSVHERSSSVTSRARTLICIIRHLGICLNNNNDRLSMRRLLPYIKLQMKARTAYMWSKSQRVLCILLYLIWCNICEFR